MDRDRRLIVASAAFAGAACVAMIISFGSILLAIDGGREQPWTSLGAGAYFARPALIAVAAALALAWMRPGILVRPILVALSATSASMAISEFGVGVGRAILADAAPESSIPLLAYAIVGFALFSACAALGASVLLAPCTSAGTWTRAAIVLASGVVGGVVLTALEISLIGVVLPDLLLAITVIGIASTRPPDDAGLPEPPRWPERLEPAVGVQSLEEQVDDGEVEDHR